jgi:hypothetical protein
LAICVREDVYAQMCRAEKKAPQSPVFGALRRVA